MKFFLKFFLFFLLSSSVALAQNIASINPIYQILLAISGDKDNSILLIPPKNSEHFFQLKKNDITTFAKANLIFYADDSFEKEFPKLINNFRLEKKSFQLSRINGIRLLQRKENSKKLDSHLWLNPQNGIKIAEFMTEKLCQSDQKNCENFRKNLTKFRREIFETEKKIRTQLEKIDLKKAVFYHDGYQYFEDYFGVKPAKVMTSDHSQDLDIKNMREFTKLVKDGGVKCVFGEAYDEKNSALKLAQNYKIRFMILDLIGSKENFSEIKNGYAVLLLNIASDIKACLS